MANGNQFSFQAPQSYYYLWHLAALGVVDATFGPLSPGGDIDFSSPDINGSVWDTIAQAFPAANTPATIALIDVGVSRSHPNLKSRLDTVKSIDLVSHPHGAKYVAAPAASPYDPEVKAAFFAGLSTAGLGALNLTGPETGYFNSLIAELAASEGVVHTLIEGDETFGSHGTAVAGLAVGEPAATVAPDPAIVLPDVLNGDDGSVVPNPNRNTLPYFGVDPFSRLISIRTGFEQQPDQFITAFLYAFASGADVILLPRGLPDPNRGALNPKPELSQDLDERQNWERADLFARLEEATPPASEIRPHAVGKTANRDLAWNILAKLIVAISRKVPVVCAAGNDGESQLIYPASLAAANNGIVAVGAVTPNGYRSGYSNYGTKLTLVAPSDDFEIYTRHQLRVDRTDPMVEQHFYHPGTGKVIPHSHFSLLTTDLPGTFGYAGGSDPYSSILPPHDNPGIGGGYYTAFGGTSGAAALVAGVAALLARANKAKQGPAAKLDGLSSKSILVAACDQNAIVKPGTTPLTPDPMNADNEPTKGKGYFFGAGLLDAGKAVAAVLGP
ncbi:S8 family serine peptidase [Aminobacter aganoensis]|uniref:Subtilisin family serine protease n=1 Tax=Aminobacter aganoensis TaxID=83264 RepID=A0A7X0F7S3_9HYPH|nr:S8 family serine peptidase [Aminobacter aganoensis]MBB6354634.1 subtilisin family serine protease [Aminobacter aganoensis]